MSVPAPPHDWTSYWDQTDDHLDIFRAEARDYASRLARALAPDPGLRVLDFGCGFGFTAEALSPMVGRLLVWDASANMRRRAGVRVAARDNVEFLDLSDVDARPTHHRFDLILVNSVAQYMTREEFAVWLCRWRAMLAPGGRIVVSDLVTGASHFLADIVEPVAFSARNGFLLRSARSGRGDFDHYRRVRRVRPLLRLDWTQLEGLVSAAGLAMRALPRNLTYRTRRATMILSEDPSGSHLNLDRSDIGSPASEQGGGPLSR